MDTESDYKHYTLKYFKAIRSSIELPDFPDDILIKINELANMVGAPSYKKTPIFKNRNKKSKKISEEDWNTIRNFKKTEFKQKNKFENEIDNLRSLLNKLTEKSFDNVKSEIISLVNCIIKDTTNDDGDNNDKLQIIGKMIFEIGSTNKFWSKLYGELYKDLIIEYPYMKDIVEKNFNDYMEVFKHIETCDPDKDYDRFCLINKTNEKRKGLSNFLIILVNIGVLDVDKMIFLIQKLFEQIKENMTIKNKTKDIDEMCENVIILITNGVNILSNTKYWDELVDIIDKYTQMSSKDYESLSKKTIIKFTLLQDHIEDMVN